MVSANGQYLEVLLAVGKKCQGEDMAGWVLGREGELSPLSTRITLFKLKAIFQEPFLLAQQDSYSFTKGTSLRAFLPF